MHPLLSDIDRVRSAARAMQPQDPNRNAGWNWLIDQPCILYTTNGETFTRRLPYYENSSPIRPYISDKDVKVEDGWVLVYRDFGTSGEGVEIPQFLLYNVFTGILRCFFFNCKIDSPFSCALIRLALVNTSPDGTVPPLLMFYSGNIAEYQVQGNYYPHKEDYLASYDEHREAVAVTKLLYREWFHADFYLIGYDPNIGDLKYRDAAFAFEIKGINEQQLTMNGSLSLTPLYEGGSSNILTDIAGFISGLPSGKALGFIKSFLSKDEANSADQGRASSENNQSVGRALLNFSTKALDEYLPGIGSVMGFIGGLIGGTSARTLVEYQGTAKFEGTLTQTSPVLCAYLRIPGVQRSGEDAKPLWDGKVGIFNLQERPEILQICRISQVEPDPMNENNTITIYENSCSVKPLQWVQNDTIPGVLKLEAARLHLGRSNGMADTHYVPIDNLKSFDFTVTDAPYTDSSDARAVGIAIRVTIVPHNPVPGFVPIHIYKAFVPVFQSAVMIHHERAIACPVDAALVHPRNGKAYFFRGDRYQRFDLKRDYVDKHNARIGIDGWRGVWNTGIDAALVHPRNGKAYFFRSDRYQRFDFDSDKVDKDNARIGIDGWKGVWNTGIDAALVHPKNGKAYFFRGDRYQRFDFDSDKVDKDNARIGIDGWKGVWNTGIDAVLILPDRTAYFLRSDRFQRFDFDLDRVDKEGGNINSDDW